MTDIDSTLIADLLRDSLRLGNTPLVTLTSNSMAPLLLKGDQIGLEAVSANRLRPGDIVVISAAQELLTHRFWGRRDEQLATRGDRSLSFDPLWFPEQLVGRVIFRRRAGREMSLRTGSGRWLSRRMFAHAQAESRLFTGFAPSPLATHEEKSRLLGRLMHRQQRHLVPRLLRRMILSANRALCYCVAGQEKLMRRGKMKSLRITLAFIITLIFLGALLVPWQQALASVSLSIFKAESGQDGIVLHWETVTEFNNLGFNVWRGIDCEPPSVKVNDSLIPAVGGGTSGGIYSIPDTDIEPRVLYNYRLQDIPRDGGEPTCHQEPEFQVQASYDPGPELVTATPNTGGGPEPTSTNAPTSTPGPTNTPVPSNTPLPAGTNSPATNTPLPPASPTNVPQTGDNNPPTATLPVAADTDDPQPPVESGGQEIDEPPPAVGVIGEGEEPLEDNNPQPTADQSEIAVVNVDAEADAQQDDESSTTNNNPVIGEGQPTPAAETTTTGESNEGGSQSVLIASGLIGGLIILLGGAAAVWFMVINRQS